VSFFVGVGGLTRGSSQPADEANAPEIVILTVSPITGTASIGIGGAINDLAGAGINDHIGSGRRDDIGEAAGESGGFHAVSGYYRRVYVNAFVRLFLPQIVMMLKTPFLTLATRRTILPPCSICPQRSSPPTCGHFGPYRQRKGPRLRL